jgi:hypothetical protein
MLRGVEGHFHLSRQRDCNGSHHHYSLLLLSFNHVEVVVATSGYSIGGRGKQHREQQELIIIGLLSGQSMGTNAS